MAKEHFAMEHLAKEHLWKGDGELASGKATGFVRFCEDEEGDTAVDVLGVVLG